MRKSLSYLLAAAALSFSAPVFAADSELVVFDWGGDGRLYTSPSPRDA